MYFFRCTMAGEMNETFMIRASTPELVNDDNELTIDKIQPKLTQVQLKTTLSNDPDQHTRAQRHQIPPMELISLPETKDNIVVNYFSFERKTNHLIN